MIVLLAGSTHTGKTLLAQKLLEKYKYPYLSIDHIKMGLIRSGQTVLTPEDDSELTVCLWSIICEIIKTAVENKQNLIVEGCYIPFDWRKDFSSRYLAEIKYYCLIMTKNYIESNFSDILKYADVIEERLDDDLSEENMITENEKNLDMCKKYGLEYILVDDKYFIDVQKMLE